MQTGRGESRFLEHRACPACGSRDNLGVWEDGHTYCFGCHYRTRATDSSSLNDIKSKLTTESRDYGQGSNRGVTLPSDASMDLPLVAIAWLKKYGLTNKEIHDNKFMWSDKYERLLFPIHGDGDLLMFQGRYFGKESKPKYFTVGNVQDTFHLLGNDPSCDVVILTEDLISAIKVSRHYYAMPLFGSHVPLKTLTRLSKMFSHVRVWLDGDKAKESLKFSSRGKAYFDSSKSIITKLDPKELDDTRIRDLVEASL